jgi:hypothetical protein
MKITDIQVVRFRMPPYLKAIPDPMDGEWDGIQLGLHQGTSH